MSALAMPAPAGRSSCAGEGRWRPHDLLRLRRLKPAGEEPAWVHEMFARTPYAVVRRARMPQGCVAVGVRGITRAERHAAWASVDDIEATIAPEDLVEIAPLSERYSLPVFAALGALRRNASTLCGFAWGPVGSAGFELATQLPTVHAASDLDLLIRVPEPLSHDVALRMLGELNAYGHYAGVRIDAQLETPAGGVALMELVSGKGRVMARDARGPALIADPWLAPSGTAEAR